MAGRLIGMKARAEGHGLGATQEGSEVLQGRVAEAEERVADAEERVEEVCSSPAPLWPNKFPSIN